MPSLLTAGLLLIPAAAAGADPGAPGPPAMEPEFLIDSYDATDPAAALNPAGAEYLVVWSEDTGAARGDDILARRVAADGSYLRRAFRISPRIATGNEWDPATAWNAAAGEYLVVWVDDRDRTTRGTDIFGRRVAADGTRIDTAFLVSDASYGDLGHAVANPVASEFLVVWEMDWISGEAYGIFGRRLAA